MQSTCRLCAAPTRERFVAAVLGKHACRYEECDGCGSLQTQRPSWLAEAYASSLTLLDTGAAERNLHNCAAVLALVRALGLRDVLDFGGGDGLLCRLLRDRGVNAYVQDKFAAPTYAPGFASPPFETPDLLLAFEVLEHFVDPADELNALLARRPAVFMATTGLYEGQGPDWWYLSRETGQHVFFFSRRALQHVAERFGYTVHFAGGYILFASPRIASRKLALAKLLLRQKVLRITRALSSLSHARGVQADFEMLRSRVADQQAVSERSGADERSVV